MQTLNVADCSFSSRKALILISLLQADADFVLIFVRKMLGEDEHNQI